MSRLNHNRWWVAANGPGSPTRQPRWGGAAAPPGAEATPVAPGIRSTVRTGADRRAERTRVLVLAGLIVAGISAYLVLGTTGAGHDRDSQRNLLPHQMLARALPEAEQAVFRSIRNALPAVEADRARTSRWPDATTLADLSARGARFGPGSAEGRVVQRWERFQQATTVSYLGVPADPASPAWLLVIQEPEPGALPDPAPNDEEHHRLPDGTVLHIYVWTHRYGSQVPARFVPQPQNDGWIEVLAAPPDPVLPARR
jgi:hypothetical protein